MRVHHMNGAGNDFMVLDARGQNLDFAPLAVELCKPTGADGFLALDNSDCADFRLHFYNADGLRGETCGNGARCICRYAYELGIVDKTMTVQTDAGLIFGQRISETVYRVELNLPSVVDLNRLPNAAYMELGDPGVPHSITEIPGLNWEMRDELREFAKAMRHNPTFPKGTNANFYTRLDATTVRILTYERGVEDYTLACGTGSASVAITLFKEGKFPGGALTVQNPGGDLTITLQTDGHALSALFLEGPAEIEKILEI